MATEIAKTGGLSSTISAAANLAQLFLGSSTSSTDTRGSTTTSSGGTTVQTTQTSVSPEAVQSTINSILSGTNGLAAVSGAQRSAGLYNSSTNQLLVNDLITRAAGEAASLNKSQTTTTVAPQVTQTTQNTGGTTSVTPAKINPSIAAGGIAALQLIPKDVKSAILGGLKLNSDSAADTASDSADAIASAFSDPSRALDVLPAAQVATDAASQAVSGFDMGALTTGLDDAASSVQDIAGGYSLTAADSASEGFSGFTDALFSLDGTDLGSSLGGFLSGVGDTVSGAVDSVSNFFSDFDFGFADGGIVSASDRAAKMEAHRNAKSGSTPKGYANGGTVTSSNLLDLGEVAYLANTGVRREGARSVSGQGAESNDPVISAIIRDQARTKGTTNREQNNLQSSGVGGQNVGAGYNSSAGESISLADSQISADPNSNPDALVSGISNVLGINQTVGKAGLSGLSMLAGIPGSVGSLANAGSKQQAVNAVLAGAASIINPVLGLVVGGLLSQTGSGKSSAEGSDTGVDSTPEGSVSVGAATPSDGVTDGVTSADNGFGGGAQGSNDGSSGTQGGMGGTAGSSADGSFASGGSVQGKGTGTSDSIPAMLSDGEYVIPADVVKALGIPFFDSIREQFHKKVA